MHESFYIIAHETNINILKIEQNRVYYVYYVRNW